LYDELEQKGLTFRPPCYLADEWLCPDKEPIIGIPFCLAHPRLKRLEKKMMLEVEGGTESTCIKLLRHECGHTYNYAYKLYKRTRWRQLFGPFSFRYSASYNYQPYSRRYVSHLGDSYAQCHPDEDFAETFAVWLAPGNRWEEKYKGWPALKKLRYVDHIAGQIAGSAPLVSAEPNPPWSASRMTSTLAAYYERKRKTLGTEFRGYYDTCLREAFSEKPDSHRPQKASLFLREHRPLLVEQVTRWTEHRKYDIQQLVTRLIQRCEALNLYASGEDLVSTTALVTAIAGNTLRNVRPHRK
ncbi:MAG TPA: hypothetical protein ENN79_15690, partial [Desulfobacteraceae bacterium]|nr:hypothetical protein [Desulfobacteraceae bacterium]